jgi:POT family proton-dependent oligopeptide transporter
MIPTEETAPQQESAVGMDTGGIFGHPRGLTNLFFTEMWERFSYYGMRALLILYMVATPEQGGLGFSVPFAASIYANYTMSVYLSSIPGGFVADRILGAKRAVFLGGCIIALGQFMLAAPTLACFYGGLILIVLGTGMLKPNITSMVGSLYGDDDPRRDAGFSIYYMGINLGAAISPLACGFLAQSDVFKNWLRSAGFVPEGSWHWGFAAAGVGMVAGLANYYVQRARLANIGGKPVRRGQQEKKLDPTSASSPHEAASEDHHSGLTSDEWKRIGAIAVLFVFNIIFWAIYEQGGSSLNLFADRLTNDQIFGIPFPSSWFQSLQPTFVILLAPVLSALWIKLDHRQPDSPSKFVLGLAFLGVSILIAVPASLLAAHGKVSPLWLFSIYFIQTIGELCLSPVGLSTVSKLAPARFLGATMGIWFVSIALGNQLAGRLATLFNEHDTNLLGMLFGGMGAVLLSAAVVLLLLVPTVRRLMGPVR